MKQQMTQVKLNVGYPTKVRIPKKYDNAITFIKVYRDELGDLDNCNHSKYNTLLDVCEIMSLDFFIIQDVVVEHGGGCDCEFFLNCGEVMSEFDKYSKKFYRVLDQDIESAIISPTMFQLNLKDYKKFNRDWHEIRQTNIVVNQFYTGLEEGYPLCCILDFISRTIHARTMGYGDHKLECHKNQDKLSGEHIKCADCVVDEVIA